MKPEDKQRQIWDKVQDEVQFKDKFECVDTWSGAANDARDDILWLIARVNVLTEALKPFGMIHESCWSRQDLMTGEGSTERAHKALEEE